MKKIPLLLLCIPTLIAGNKTHARENHYATALTAGYVFKNDGNFKKVYGHGVVNAITGDFCYYRWHHWGFGTKLSYWAAKGKTTFLQQRTFLQEIPVTFYLRGIKEFCSKLQLYASLGGGFAWIQEKSYLGHKALYKGIGEVEIGLNYPIWRCVGVTSALRYLFPPQSQGCNKKDVGGVDLRAGLCFSF